MEENINELKEEMNEAQMELFAGLAESFLPKVTPLLKPGLKKLEKHLKESNMFYFLQFNSNDEIVLVSVPWEDVINFDCKTEKIKHKSINDFVDMILKGDFTGLK